MAFLKQILFLLFLFLPSYYPTTPSFPTQKVFIKKQIDFKQHRPIIPANQDAEAGELQF